MGSAPIAGVYGINWDGQRATPGLVGISRVPITRAVAHVEWLLGERKLTYDPLNVARADQNKVQTADDLIRSGRVSSSLRDELARVGQRLSTVRTPEQIRVLVSEGNTMLAWVGAMTDDPSGFGQKERSLLRSLIPDFRRRLLFAQRVANEPLRAATLQATLEALTEPVFVVAQSGRPVIMNTGARALWSAHRHETSQDISDALQGDTRKFRVSSVVGKGIPAHALLVRHAVGTASIARQHHAVKSWGLTAREGEVLSLVAQGRTNAAIARDLACAERTVELHVTHLLKKARVLNRASLVAQFWSGKST